MRLTPRGLSTHPPPSSFRERALLVAAQGPPEATPWPLWCESTLAALTPDALLLRAPPPVPVPSGRKEPGLASSALLCTARRARTLTWDPEVVMEVTGTPKAWVGIVFLPMGAGVSGREGWSLATPGGRTQVCVGGLRALLSQRQKNGEPGGANPTGECE